MARKPKVKLKRNEKSDLTVTDSRITAATDVRNSPFRDRTVSSIKLDARKKSASAGSILIELTGRGNSSLTARKKAAIEFDGILLVTLTGIIPPLPTDVTYVPDPGVRGKTKTKTAKKKPGKPAAKKKR